MTPNKYKKSAHTKRWTDTMFPLELLLNPCLLSHTQLADALQEHQDWRKGEGRYYWDEDPFQEGAETEAPFSPKVLSKITAEAITRLRRLAKSEQS